MGTCTRLHRVRGEIYVFGGGVTTENDQKCTSESLSDFRAAQSQGGSLLSRPDSRLHPGTHEEMSPNCRPHSRVHDNEVLAAQLLH